MGEEVILIKLIHREAFESLGPPDDYVFMEKKDVDAIFGGGLTAFVEVNPEIERLIASHPEFVEDKNMCLCYILKTRKEWVESF